MKKHLIKVTAIALCLISAAAAFTACTSKEAITLEAKDVDVYVYSNDYSVSDKLTDTGANKVTYSDNTLRVDIDKDVIDVEFDLAPFFTENDVFLGKNFYFTRDDVKKGDGTLIKGSAWVEVEGGTAGSRLFKKLGYEDDEETEPMTKSDIAALEDGEGESRMYILTKGTQAGKHIVYIDPTTSSNVESGETRVTFRLHGNHGKSAELKVLVNKAS